MSATDTLLPWKAEAINELRRVAASAVAEHEERLRGAGWPPFAAFTVRHKAYFREAIQQQLHAALGALVAARE